MNVLVNLHKQKNWFKRKEDGLANDRICLY